MIIFDAYGTLISTGSGSVDAARKILSLQNEKQIDGNNTIFNKNTLKQLLAENFAEQGGGRRNPVFSEDDNAVMRDLTQQMLKGFI